MTIKEIQIGVINEVGYLYEDEQFFTHDIHKTNTLFDLIDALCGYGYDKQGALGILNNVILTSK
jgi:hypothetical protein